MKRTIALMLVLSLLIFGLATTANALWVCDDEVSDDPGVDGGEIADDASCDEEPGVDGGETAEEATPDFDDAEFPAESGGWMK